MKFPRAHHLSAEELAGQMLMPAIPVQFINRQAPKARHLLQLVKRYQPGGIILFGGHPADVRYWVEQLQKVARFPLLVAADLERGVGGLFKAGTAFPHALAWGAANSKELNEAAANCIAREACSLGINTIFAPVLDLVTQPENPIINIRGYHADPQKVAEWGKQFINTVQAHGLACVAKHFPGHGKTRADSHLVLPEIPLPFSELENEDIIPFRHAVEAEVQGIMSAHIRFTDGALPATFRSDILARYLRQTLNYPGIIFSDALNMTAISQHFSIQEQVSLGLEAGLDVFLMPERLARFFQILVELIRTSSPTRKRAEESVERIFKLKKWIRPHYSTSIPPGRIYKFLSHPSHVGMANRLAEQAVTCIHRQQNFPVNLPEIRNCLHIIHTDFIGQDSPLSTLQENLTEFFDSVITFENPTVPQIQRSAIPKPDLVIYSLYSRTYGGHRSKFDWKEINRTLSLYDHTQTPVVILIFGNPFYFEELKHWENSQAVFLLYSYVAASQQAAFKALTSFIPVKAQLPIRFATESAHHTGIRIEPRTYRLEADPLRIQLPETDQLIETAIQKGIFPGAVLFIALKQKIIYWQAYGYFDFPEKNQSVLPVEPETCYDLASLTKVLATTPAILKLVDRGELSLNEPLVNFYPSLKNQPLGEATVADLLAHQAGLIHWKPFYPNYHSASEIIHDILTDELVYPPGKSSRYSDLGFILLGDIIQRVSDLPLEVFCRDYIFQPLALNSLHFRPVSATLPKKPTEALPARKELRKYPPTGFDPFRQRTLQGEVNDTNCFVIGGVAGHAGLFGHAGDVAAIGQLFLNKGIYNARRFLKYETAHQAVRKYNPTLSNRALGWDTPDPESSSGQYFSTESFGHLAYTGPSIWVDTREQIIMVFLCNSTHPQPKPDQMKTFRPELHNQLFRELYRMGLLKKND
ncbi:MAG: glycoside hydrolase family 3 N-terminal domain-containing protein [Calditrichia bacterium]